MPALERENGEQKEADTELVMKLETLPPGWMGGGFPLLNTNGIHYSAVQRVDRMCLLTYLLCVQAVTVGGWLVLPAGCIHPDMQLLQRPCSHAQVHVALPSNLTVLI